MNKSPGLNKLKINKAAWKILFIDEEGSLSIQHDTLVLERKDTRVMTYPLYDVGAIIHEAPFTTMSSGLIDYCLQHGVQVIFFHPQKGVVGSLNGTAIRGEGFQRIPEQLQWKQSRKDRLWQAIVINKIKQQHRALIVVHGEVNDALANLALLVKPGDLSIVEGQAAKLYFHALFGRYFVRFSKDALNGALNYGYALLHALVLRIVIKYGHLPYFGIHHKSPKNPNNLSYDLIEPFRVFIDRLVAETSLQPTLDKTYLKKVFSISIKLGEKVLPIREGIDTYILQALKYLKLGKGLPDEVAFS